jgi:hypothetical protein
VARQKNLPRKPHQHVVVAVKFYGGKRILKSARPHHWHRESFRRSEYPTFQLQENKNEIPLRTLVSRHRTAGLRNLHNE